MTLSAEERVRPAFIADCSGWPMAGIHDGFVRQNHEFLTNALYQAFVTAARKIGPPDTKLE